MLPPPSDAPRGAPTVTGRAPPPWRRLADAAWTSDEQQAVAAYLRGVTWQSLAWVVGFGFDLLALAFVWPEAPWRWVLGLRLAGTPMQPGLIVLARRRLLDDGTLTLVAWLHMVAVAALLALQSLALGGLESPWVLGLLGFTFAGSLVAQVRASRVAATVVAWFVVWIAVLGASARVLPSIAAQWSTPRAPVFHLGLWAIVAAVAAGSVHFGHRIAALQRELQLARRLAGYRLKARIGVGGMNEVWLAWDERARRDVALKILHRDPSPEEARRFQREAEALRALDSEHTVRVFEAGASDDGVMFIAMERLEGADLERVVEAAGPLEVGRAVALVRQACDSLAEAHARGIVHRDVKPSNLFLVRDPVRGEHVKVLDFGIARRIAGDEARVTRAGEAIGTPHYMAPESFAGGEPAPAVDVYGLGATLYFLVTGARPFEGRGPAEVMAAAVSGPLAPPSTHRPVAPGVEAVILRALSRDVAARYTSVAELAAALAAAAADPAPPRERPSRSAPRAEPGPRRIAHDAPTSPVRR